MDYASGLLRGYCASKIQSHAAVTRDPSVTQGAPCPSRNDRPFRQPRLNPL